MRLGKPYIAVRWIGEGFNIPEIHLEGFLACPFPHIEEIYSIIHMAASFDKQIMEGVRLNALRFGTNIPNEERNESTRFSLSFL